MLRFYPVAILMGVMFTQVADADLSNCGVFRARGTFSWATNQTPELRIFEGTENELQIKLLSGVDRISHLSYVGKFIEAEVVLQRSLKNRQGTGVLSSLKPAMIPTPLGGGTELFWKAIRPQPCAP